MKLRLPLLAVCTLCCLTASASSESIARLRDSFREASIASFSPSEAITENFLRYSEYGYANDVLLLQLYTSVALPYSEVERLISLWENDHFTDIDYSNQDRGRWQPSLHVTRLQALAKIYSNPDSNWYRNPQLHAILHGGLAWWFRNMPECLNWWHNDIGVPKKMTATLLMLFDELSQAEIDGGLRVLEHSAFGKTGQNKSWLAGNQLMKGMLIGDEALVIKARDTLAEEICFTDGDEGIRDDWSFHQHGPQMQFGNYGMAYLEGMAFWMRVLEGTDYQFSDEQCDIITNLMDKGIRWCFWKGVIDPNFTARQCFPDAGRGKAYSMAVASQNLATYAYKKGLLDDAERYCSVAMQNLQPSMYPNELVGAVWFPRSDCGIYRTSGWYSSVRMSSVRTVGYEFTNRENTLAHFSASGAVLLLQSGNEYDNIFACWDWRKVPGVTAYDDGKPIRSSNSRKAKQNNSSDVGGHIFVREDGAQCLEAHMQIDRDSLLAYKTMLFTPDYILEEGRDIRTLNPDVVEVTTSINQTRLNGRVRRGHVRKDGVRCEWVWHDGVAYVALDGAHINVSTDIQTGDWGAIDPALSGRADSCRVFKAWISHPEALASSDGSGSYKFAVIPGAGRFFVASRIRKIDIQ